MALIRVFGNIFLNPAIIGKAIRDVKFDKDRRITTTKLYDLSGKVELAVCETIISIEYDRPDKNAAARDNFFHDEMIRSINNGCDAREFTEPAT